MKKIDRLKLDQLCKNSLDARQQNSLKGGAECRCTCSQCQCSSWDGTGSMPVGQSGNDLGIGSANRNSASMRQSYF